MTTNQRRTLGLINRIYGKVEMHQGFMGKEILVWLPIYNGHLYLRSIIIAENGRIF